MTVASEGKVFSMTVICKIDMGSSGIGYVGDK
jgi:hypothetical protein